MNIQHILNHLNACKPALDWADGKDLKENWETCARGDWMLWLLRRSTLFATDHRKFTMAKWVCANQVRHLMKDERSINALDVAFKYANNELGISELAVAAAAAYTAVSTAASTVAADAYTAAYVAATVAADVSAEADAASAAANAVAATVATDDVAAAKIKMLTTCADEIRKIISWTEIQF